MEQIRKSLNLIGNSIPAVQPIARRSRRSLIIPPEVSLLCLICRSLPFFPTRLRFSWFWNRSIPEHRRLVCMYICMYVSVWHPYAGVFTSSTVSFYTKPLHPAKAWVSLHIFELYSPLYKVTALGWVIQFKGDIKKGRSLGQLKRKGYVITLGELRSLLGGSWQKKWGADPSHIPMRFRSVIREIKIRAVGSIDRRVENS